MNQLADIFPVVAAASAGVAAFFAIGTYGLVEPTSSMWGPVVWRGETSSNAIALTFDDGPMPGSTDRILDTLGELGVQAAFFVIGRYAREYPDLVRRMHDEGHLVGNHSFDHLHTGLFGRYRYWVEEIGRGDDAVQQIIGQRPAIFRPPMGYKHWHVMNAAADVGHTVVTWSRRARDARTTPADVILKRLAEPARGGDIMLLHDGNDPCRPPQDRTGTRDAVRPLIEALRRRGLQAARLDDLLQLAAYREPAEARLDPSTRATPSPPPGGAGGC